MNLKKNIKKTANEMKWGKKRKLDSIETGYKPTRNL